MRLLHAARDGHERGTDADAGWKDAAARFLPSLVESEKSSGLIQAIGRWTLTALVVNSIVGSGIFGLPSLVSGYVGRWSPLAYLIAAVIVAVIMGCFAEVASRFGESGGPYLYAREAFGRFVGIEMWWPRLVGGAKHGGGRRNHL